MEAFCMSFHAPIRDFVINTFLFGDAGKLNDSDSLLSKGIIDSTGVLEVVQFIEDTWKIKVDDNELLPENLDSVNNIAAYVERKTVKA
jgi:acyl carrier protein